MAHCKHWHDGVCKDCRKNCPIKKKLAAKAARKAARLAEKAMPPVGDEQGAAVDVSGEILRLATQAAGEKKGACAAGKKSGEPLSVSSPDVSIIPTPADDGAEADEAELRDEALLGALVHGRRVAEFARELFRATQELHGLDALWGGVLDWAALLHDVGWVGGQRAHHKRSARMIRQNRVPGQDVPANLRAYAALVARYHRRRDPSRRQRRFAALDAAEQRAVRQLAALLRLADALDYSHTGAVGKLEARLDGDALVLKVKSALGCSAELHRLDGKAELFRQVFEKEVRRQCKKRARA